MKKPLIILAAILVVAVSFSIWWYSPTQVVKRKSQALIQTLTIHSDDGKTERASKNQTFSSLIGSPFTAEVSTAMLSRKMGASEATESHLVLTQVCSSSSLEISNMEIETSGDSITVTGAAKVHVSIKDGGSHSESGKATLIWKQQDNEWK
ncbi:MAG: DUF4440 domain-containing protein, partial [Akkermansiaceae bacterium]